MTVRCRSWSHGPQPSASQQLPGGNRIDDRLARRSPGDDPLPDGAASLALGSPAEPAGSRVRAGTTQRHVSFIEQGRSRPGRGMVVRLAESMELTLRERNECSSPPASPQRSPSHRSTTRRSHRCARHSTPSSRATSRTRRSSCDRTASSSPRTTPSTCSTKASTPHCCSPPSTSSATPSTPTAWHAGFATCPPGGGTSPSTCGRSSPAAPTRGWRLARRARGDLPPLPAEVDVLGFAVPLELASADGDLRLITTLTSFATAADVTLAELPLEAFLPADEPTAKILRRRWA